MNQQQMATSANEDKTKRRGQDQIMKNREFILTFDAEAIQKQINNCKHERAKKLLESRLVRTYMESYIDLEKKKATIIIGKNNVSNNAREYLKEMGDKVMHDYKIEHIDVYTYSKFYQLLKSGKIEFPKSSIIRPKLENDENTIPQVMIDGVSDIYSDTETRSRVEILYDVKDDTLQKMGFTSAIENNDLEAGNIIIIVETKGESKIE